MGDSKYTYSCDDCYYTWDTDHEELVCPVCGSWNTYNENQKVHP